MAEKKPWEEDYGNTAVAEKLPWEEDYSKPQGATETPGLMDRISTNFKNIGAAAEDNVKTPTELEKGLSVAGRTIGAVGSIPVEASKSVYGAVSDFAKTHPTITNYAKAGLQSITGPLIPAAEAAAPIVKKGLETAGGKINEFAEAHPRAATLAETGLNLASAIPAGKIVSGIAPKLGLSAAESLEKGAARIQGTKVKINSPEFKKGAQNEMYTKYEVFGDAPKVQKQWQQKIDDTYNQVKERIQNVPDSPENYATIDDIFSAAEKSAETYGKSRTAIQSIKNSLANLKTKFEEAYPDGKISLIDAQTEKQVAGKTGDWLARAGEISGNPDASVNSQAHNALYDALKTNVENKGAPGIKELNKQLSEMIPMERAAAKQVLVSNRKNLIPLDAFIGGLHTAGAAMGGHVAPALLTVGTLGTRSPLVARGLLGASKGLRFASEKNLTQ